MVNKVLSAILEKSPTFYSYKQNERSILIQQDEAKYHIALGDLA